MLPPDPKISIVALGERHSFESYLEVLVQTLRGCKNGMHKASIDDMSAYLLLPLLRRSIANRLGLTMRRLDPGFDKSTFRRYSRRTNHALQMLVDSISPRNSCLVNNRFVPSLVSCTIAWSKCSRVKNRLLKHEIH